MDILISLLYTGAQDGWVTINGRARRPLENKDRRGGARGGASEGEGVGWGGGVGGGSEMMPRIWDLIYL